MLTVEQVSDLRSMFGDTVRTGQLFSYDRRICKLVTQQGALKKLAHGVFCLTDIPGHSVRHTPERCQDLEAHITERFGVLGVLANGIVDGHVRSLIVAGAAGVGKTFTLEEKLRRAARVGKINGYETVKGSISAIGLYSLLWENKKEGDIVLLDDADVFGDEEALNLLKAALDTSRIRSLSWRKDSSYLRDREIPTNFDYEGQIVFLTNIDIETAIERNSKNAAHLKALISRSTLLDLGIHSNEAILIRVEQVLRSAKLARETKLTPDQTEELAVWLRTNVQRMRQVSIRSVLQLAGFMRTSSDWQRIASATMLRSIR